ncbi:MAG: hypothetical protein QM636_09255 [Rhizobium sp.]
MRKQTISIIDGTLYQTETPGGEAYAPVALDRDVEGIGYEGGNTPRLLLLLISGSKRYLAHDTAGFEQLEAWMFSRPDFDRAFYHSLKPPAPTPEDGGAQFLWQSPARVNTRLACIPRPDGLDRLHEGLWLEDRTELLPWGVTWEDLLERPDVLEPPISRGHTRLRLSPATILGGVSLVEVESEYRMLPFRSGMPVTEFRAEICLERNGYESLRILSDHFNGRLGEPVEIRERDDSIKVSWLSGRQRLELSCEKWRGFNAWQVTCRLRLAHQPDASSFLRDDYTRTLTIHDDLHWQVLPARLRLPSDFKTCSELREMPDALKSLLKHDDHCLLWRDDRAGTIGIGNQNHACIFATLVVGGIQIEERYFRDHFSHCNFSVGGVVSEGDMYSPWSVFIDLKSTDPEVPPVMLARLIEELLRLPVAYQRIDEYY